MTQQRAASLILELLEEAGLPPGVINMVMGTGEVSKVALTDEDLAGIHFTGSTPTFKHLWKEVVPTWTATAPIHDSSGDGRQGLHRRPPLRRPGGPRTAMIRGAFEYQGQKCSAASRAYVPATVWKQVRDDMVDLTNG